MLGNGRHDVGDGGGSVSECGTPNMVDTSSCTEFTDSNRTASGPTEFADPAGDWNASLNCGPKTPDPAGGHPPFVEHGGGWAFSFESIGSIVRISFLIFLAS